MSGITPFDLDRALHMTGEGLDSLPFGVIVVNASGKILEYNQYERDLVKMGSRPVIGKNFFDDVAPCTAIQEFKGRLGIFLNSEDTSIEPFEFVFALPSGAQKVSVIFARLARDDDRAMICVIRTEVPEQSSP